MRLLILSDPSSSHTQKWANSLKRKGLEILIYGLNDVVSENLLDGLQVRCLSVKRDISNKSDGSISKVVYLKALPDIYKIIKDFRPDILHAHYLTSYGFLGALSQFHPFVVSVWGSDIFTFPRKNIVYKKLVQFNISKAERILSTSNIMAEEINKYTTRKIEVVPFGIDLSNNYKAIGKFLFKDTDIVIGTVKLLENIYGIDLLIRAFRILKDKYPHLPMKLLIVGDGSQKNALKDLVSRFNLQRDTIFTGYIPHKEIMKYHAEIDIPVFLSRQESFGVSVLEAGFCSKPVVASEIPGFKEIIDNGYNGLLVSSENPSSAAEAIERLIFDRNLRSQLGNNAKDRVMEKYDWSQNVSKMIEIYESLIC